MTWVRIDDAFSQHPKLARVGPLGMAMQVAALCYCNRLLTDGFVPRAMARTLVDWEMTDADGVRWIISRSSGMVGDDLDADWVIDTLLDAGIWELADGGYQIHDYAQYQPTKAQVEAERAKKQDAGRAGGQASAQARAQAKPNPRTRTRTQEMNNPPVSPHNPNESGGEFSENDRGTDDSKKVPKWLADLHEQHYPMSITPTVLDDLAAFLAAGVTEADMRDAYAIAAGNGAHFGYVKGVLRDRAGKHERERRRVIAGVETGSGSAWEREWLAAGKTPEEIEQMRRDARE